MHYFFLGSRNILLKVVEVSRKIQDRIIFERVSLSASKGELTTITGPSGSGKTTLLRCIMGIDQPDSGTISLAGEVFSSYPTRQRREFRLKNIGVVDQENRLIEDLNCRDNIRLIAEMSGGGRKQSFDTSKRILERLNMEEYGNRYPGSLSGGERQRISIGCALANTPSIIAADEPTSSLDDEAADTVLHLFLDLARQFQIPVLLVTHDYRVRNYASAEYNFGRFGVPR